MRAAIAAGDIALVGRLAHATKGSAAQVGADVATEGHARAVAAVEQGRDQAQGVHAARVLGGGQARHVEAQEHARQLGLHTHGQQALARLCGEVNLG